MRHRVVTTSEALPDEIDALQVILGDPNRSRLILVRSVIGELGRNGCTIRHSATNEPAALPVGGLLPVACQIRWTRLSLTSVLGPKGTKPAAGGSSLSDKVGSEWCSVVPASTRSHLSYPIRTWVEAGQGYQAGAHSRC